MKLLTRCMSALLLMVLTQTLHASDEPTISIRNQKGQSFSLHLKDINNETFRVKLKDVYGIVLLQEKVKGQDDYLKFFDLRNLPTGDYILSIENDRKVVLQTIHVHNRDLAIDPAEKKEIQKPSADGENAKPVDKTNVPSDPAQHVPDAAIMNKIKWLNSEKN